jgi:hypothetical protein
MYSRPATATFSFAAWIKSRTFIKYFDERYGKTFESFRNITISLDPFYARSSSDTNIVTNEQIISFKDFITVNITTSFLKHQAIHSEMVIYLRSQTRRLGVIALFRPPREWVSPLKR